MFRRVNPYLGQKISHMLQSGSIADLSAFLASLSTSEHKTAGHLLASELLINIDEQTFHEAFISIVPQNSKIYLTTFLKAFIKRYELKKSDFQTALWEAYATLSPTEIDGQKLLNQLLPVAPSYDEVALLLRLYAPEEAAKRIAILLRIKTPTATYALFQETQTEEGNAPLLRTLCIALAKRGDACALRLASLLQAYHALTPIPGIPPTSVPPYKFSCLTEGYESFLTTLQINPSLDI